MTMHTQNKPIFAQQLRQTILNWQQCLTAVLAETYTAAQLEDALTAVLKQDKQSVSDKLSTMLTQGVDHFRTQPLTEVSFVLTIELMTVIQEAHHLLLITEQLGLTNVPGWDFHSIAANEEDEYIALKILELAGMHSEARRQKRDVWQGLNAQT